MRKAYRIVIGFQQNAPGFRFFACKKGRETGIKGVIPCLRSNLLIIHAEGTPDMINHYLELLKEGTPFCRINSISCEEVRVMNFTRLDLTQHQLLYPESTISPLPRFSSWLGFFGF
ncbi:MAG: acylphosphatase [Bacteroidales bacterium]|jgi:acylphosphatase|nr:acylphosphatase [Bacteroidales bacterium]